MGPDLCAHRSPCSLAGSGGESACSSVLVCVSEARDRMNMCRMWVCMYIACVCRTIYTHAACMQGCLHCVNAHLSARLCVSARICKSAHLQRHFCNSSVISSVNERMCQIHGLMLVNMQGCMCKSICLHKFLNHGRGGTELLGQCSEIWTAKWTRPLPPLGLLCALCLLICFVNISQSVES